MNTIITNLPDHLLRYHPSNSNIRRTYPRKYGSVYTSRQERQLFDLKDAEDGWVRSIGIEICLCKRITNTCRLVKKEEGGQAGRFMQIIWSSNSHIDTNVCLSHIMRQKLQASI
ncbi:hypothetical protein K439DRAFT_1197765 [Ramaria rubella]|nr:hypothetical protein K439DRAFT_165101 [Ramaria rubella]KAF8583792.1 hypothetical protein K439DRAFT_1197765 [Ramaria rubella]